MDGVSVLPFSPSLLTALHSVVFLFQKSKPFFVISVLPRRTVDDHLASVVYPRTWEDGNMT